MNDNGNNHGNYNNPCYMKVGDDVVLAPELMTMDELVVFLRLPEISKSSNYNNVIKNLIRMRDLPRIEISHKLLFPKKAILEWIDKQTTKN